MVELSATIKSTPLFFEGHGGNVMKSVNLTIVMPTYNRAELLRENIRLLLDSDYAFELLVVDDGSIDSTERVVKSTCDSRISYYRHPVNCGYAKSLNDGIRRAKNSRILLCEDDVFISNPDEFIKILDSEMGNKRIVATHMLKNGKEIKPDLLERFRRYFAEPLAKEIYNYNGCKRRVIGFCNNCFGFDRDEIRTRFDEPSYKGNSFRIESDFQIRARNDGAKIVYNPKLVIDHKRYTSGGLRVSDADEFLYQCMLNHITFLRKHYSKWNALIYVTLYLLSRPTKKHVIKKVLKTEMKTRRDPLGRASSRLGVIAWRGSGIT
jgi:glycosyltransferase involved in cell wall biosynthesis